MNNKMLGHQDVKSTLRIQHHNQATHIGNQHVVTVKLFE